MGVFSIVVNRHERVLAIRDGAVVSVLGPGRYPRRRRTTYERVDVREQITSMAGQDILTADGVGVKVSLALRWRVADPVAFTAAADPVALIYLSVQVALREQVVELPVEQLIRNGRASTGAQLLPIAQDTATPLGIEVLAVVIKDIVLPTELRAAFADLVASRQRGLAQLETARAESAALRSMANAARLLDEHPALARLRLVQAAGYGSKLVLELPQSAVQQAE